MLIMPLLRDDFHIRKCWINATITVLVKIWNPSKRFRNRYKFNIIQKENGYILLIDIGTKCLFAPIMGILSDKYGRVPIL